MFVLMHPLPQTEKETVKFVMWRDAPLAKLENHRFVNSVLTAQLFWIMGNAFAKKATQ